MENTGREIGGRLGPPELPVSPGTFFRVDHRARLLAVLDDEQVERIAERVVALLLERNQRGASRERS